MCAEYHINKQPKEIRDALRQGREPNEWTYRPTIKLFSSAPVVVGEDFEIKPMRFSLKPPGTKYSTFNARLFDYDEKKKKVITLADKWTWKKPIAETRCLVPMTGFVEPIYTGELAGNMVEFSDKVIDLVFAAGIYEVGVDLKTGEEYTGFSLIMGEALPFVQQTGHHRSPKFLKPSAFKDWFSPDLEVEDAIQMLESETQKLKLQADVVRPMAKGWEKRIKNHVDADEWERNFEEIRKQKT